MRLVDYNELLESLTSEDCDGTTASLLHIQEKFPDVSHSTLISIYSQHCQMITRQTYHQHNNPDMISYYVQEYQIRVKQNESSPVLVQMAKEVCHSNRLSMPTQTSVCFKKMKNRKSKQKKAHMPPAVIARFVVEGLYEKASNQEVTKSTVTHFLREPYLIEDPLLAYQVQLCTLQDITYGPYAESIKHSVGNEYEFLLVQLLKERKIAFLQEDDMRKKGYDKTPDTKLEVPVAWNGHIINWIESKASFGDVFSHNNYLKDQYLSYANRFGSGLVIYWHGFIDELATGCIEQGIALADHLPEDLTHLQP